MLHNVYASPPLAKIKEVAWRRDAMHYNGELTKKHYTIAFYAEVMHILPEATDLV